MQNFLEIKTGASIETMYSLWSVLVEGAKKNEDMNKTARTSFVAEELIKNYSIEFASAHFIAANLATQAKLLYGDEQINPDVEAVQIEWISNGILVRGKSADGSFCNYYRDTSQFISQSVGGRAIQLVKNKKPKVGDTCILYFGMSDEASE